MITGQAAVSVVSRCRVSLAGHITYPDVAGAGACALSLSAASGQGPVGGRTYQARIRPNGLYYFENVPPGSYRLAGRDGKGRTLGRSVTLPPGERGEHPPVVELDLQFIEATPEHHPSTNAWAPPARRGRGVRTGR
ncbi:MAG: hypothetical protein JOZ17_21275 [Acetobacteraceae bacterium]|nr:hypothetical protein [Acetobacteraceae bacterium]MBV8614642.1 hypothetical protein [Acetobacteraceae bacterium]